MKEQEKRSAGEELPCAGLAAEEVNAAIAAGKFNRVKEKSGKSYGRIVVENVCTFFNLVWAIVATVLIIIGRADNLTFLGVIIPNMLIAVMSEIKAKRTVEKLSVTTEPKAMVVRDGTLCEIAVTDIVEGDVLKIEMGKQVLSDAVVLSGFAEANESMLTGESDAIKKTEGDTVLAGSFLVSGSIFAKVIRVGAENYVHTIERAAKGFKAPASNLFRDLNRLIKYIGIMLVPMAAAMYITNYFYYVGTEMANPIYEAIVKTCGSVIGMIPAGAYLLVTVTLTLSVIKLGKKRTLVQDMYSIEMLASADVLCLDKTGTITDGTMCVSSVDALSSMNDDEIRAVVAKMQGAEKGINNTSRALMDYFGTSNAVVSEYLPFSSQRKYSAVSFEEGGTYAIGAPHFVPCPVSAELEERINVHAAKGERVLLLVRAPAIGVEGEVVALIAIADRIRPSAESTIAKFQEQGVSVKIISGDHAATVSAIAGRVGVVGHDKYISCENLTDEQLAAACEEYTVFGRVTPEQKVLLVKKLKENGHTVAMTGDGVNDTLALKEANCAIAMAEGSEVACKVSQIVLLNSDFSTLPDVVKEGRRCINNVRRSASLFLMKTIFTICLSLFAVCTVSGYPFEPKQFSLLELFVIGIGSFLLALEPNYSRIEGSFLKRVLIKSVPYALVMFLPVLMIMIVGMMELGISADCRNAVATVIVTMVGFINLLFLCRPFSKWRVGVCALVGAGLGACFAINVFIEDYLKVFSAMENPMFLFGAMGFAACLALLFHIVWIGVEKKVVARMERRKKSAK